MSVQTIELRKGDITQGVNYPKDGLEALHGPMLRRVHILHQRGSGCWAVGSDTMGDHVEEEIWALENGVEQRS